MTAAIVDTGPLVAFLDRAERHHHWVVTRVDRLDPPLLVCEPVLAEAMHLLARFPRGQDSLYELLENGALRIAFRIGEHLGALKGLKLADLGLAQPFVRPSPVLRERARAELKNLRVVRARGLADVVASGITPVMRGA
jgi:predicted nucleic acid-binding protein